MLKQAEHHFVEEVLEECADVSREGNGTTPSGWPSSAAAPRRPSRSPLRAVHPGGDEGNAPKSLAGRAGHRLPGERRL